MTTPDVSPVTRTRPTEDGTELATLTGLLDFLRSTAGNKVAGLTDASRPVKINGHNLLVHPTRDRPNVTSR